MTTGKRLENNFKLSVPSDIFFYRFKDGTSSWGGNEMTRFQAKNICDCLMFDGSRLFLVELKSTKGKSLPFSNIRTSQIEDLSKANKFKNIVAGFFIEFNEIDRAFFIKIEDFISFQKTSSRKSIPIKELEKSGTEVEITKLRVNNRFNIKKMIGDVK